MAILRSADGKYYDVDESVLAGHEVKVDSLPANMKSGPPSASAGGGAPGLGALSGLVQIIINLPPAAGSPPPSEDGGGDVVGHDSCGYWHNCWHNAWHNAWHNYHY